MAPGSTASDYGLGRRGGVGRAGMRTASPPLFMQVVASTVVETKVPSLQRAVASAGGSSDMSDARVVTCCTAALGETGAGGGG